MTANANGPASAGQSVVVPVQDVERELTRQMNAVTASGQAPVLRACMSNLVIFCDSAELAERVRSEIPAIVAVHPARVLLVVGTSGSNTEDVTATVLVQRHGDAHGRATCTEQVTLQAQGHAVEQLPFAVRSLLIGDLPTNLWWAASVPPPMAGALLFDLAEHAQQLVYDSRGWTDPHRGVAATAAWLAKFERPPGNARWRVASDLSWRRLKYWRRVLSQGLDPASAPGALESITEVLVEHGPHAVTQAWGLVGWLAARLGWRVQAARLEPNVEICWQVHASNNRKLRVRIHRLVEGPPEVRHIRIACSLGGKPGALDFAMVDERRLAVLPEGSDLSPRTVTIQPQSLPEMLARQLSDREPDPVFRESMVVAHVFAQSVLS
jgi:glucose-6-phosphate dehydrogenase assembly protein OpcA